MNKMKALALLFGNKIIFGDGYRYVHIKFCKKSIFEVVNEAIIIQGLFIDITEY